MEYIQLIYLLNINAFIHNVEILISIISYSVGLLIFVIIYVILYCLLYSYFSVVWTTRLQSTGNNYELWPLSWCVVVLILIGIHLIGVHIFQLRIRFVIVTFTCLVFFIIESYFWASDWNNFLLDQNKISECGPLSSRSVFTCAAIAHNFLG